MANPRSNATARGVTRFGKLTTVPGGTFLVNAVTASATSNYVIPCRFKRFYLRGIRIQAGTTAVANVTSMDIVTMDITSGGAAAVNTLGFTAFTPNASQTGQWWCSVNPGQSFYMDSLASTPNFGDTFRITSTTGKPFAVDGAADSSIYEVNSCPGISITCAASATGSFLIDLFVSPAEEYGQ